MRQMRLIALAALLMAAAAAPVLAADIFVIDPVHSEVGFGVSHMVISTVKGEFTDYTGTIVYDPSDLAKSSVEVQIKTASIDTGNADRDKHLCSDDFFAAATYPEITFKSTSIEKSGSRYVTKGPLTMHGVSKDIALVFDVTGIIKDPMGSTRMGVKIDPITINRQDFGMTFSKTLDGGGLLIGNDVTIELGIEAVKKTTEGKS